MSLNVSYIPGSDADRVIWLNNFSTKIGTYATLVGVATAEVTSVQKDTAMFSYMVNMLEVYKQTLMCSIFFIP
jgi:hypothetical protein